MLPRVLLEQHVALPVPLVTVRTQVFRESAFKMFDVPEPPVLKPNQKIRTVVLDRKGRKKMTNPDKVVDVIQQTELAKFDFLPETKKQVRSRHRSACQPWLVASAGRCL